MRAIDTSVVARFLIRDDERQADLAAETIQAGVFVSNTVLLEVVWLLGSRFGMDRTLISETLIDFISYPSVSIEHSRVVWALERYRDRGGFSDLMHLVSARHAESFLTFDRGIAGAAGPDAPVPVETLTA